MTWLARLDLDYTLEAERSVARYLHQGPLRILQSLYPEGDAVCHNVLVHPPSGLVGGDTLDMKVTVGPGAHGLVTTPGATRFYRSEAGLAAQQVHTRLESGARLEWLPLEAIAYNGCDGLNRAVFDLAPGAELITWDITALGLPAADMPFAQGTFRQHMEIPGVWLERGTISATDTRLMDSPLGLAGKRCMATLVFAAGSAIASERSDRALACARELLEASELRLTAGATSPHKQVIVLRALAPVTEPAMRLLRKVWAAWRHEMWALPGTYPRLWHV
ncbi:urease accessory protein UreD [Limnohabitans planktonicus]|uniref:Urease accessory protein UreD n=1 Tax=Limnohabitans planktonicus II-D5 TaxID=1293045 RepID=A0A2T7UF65_9BURK|nr:urease accessory protein UreD [Limnohabitans planktonicus]PVE43347.1 urease accessory protein [Limnohabitans planktonicus II-D5]